jgi:hypothetical protein
MVDKALRHRERVIPDVERQQQFILGVHGHPHPLEYEAQLHQGDQYQLIEKESGNHGKPPSYKG